MKRKAVRVSWRDSRMYVTQTDGDQIEGVCTIHSVGILMEEHTDRVIISRDHLDGDQWRGVLVIPRENIVKMKVLR